MPLVEDWRRVEFRAGFFGDSTNENLFSRREIRASWEGDMFTAVLLKIFLLNDKFILTLDVTDILGDFYFFT